MNKQDVLYQEKLNELKLDIPHPKSLDINFILVEGDSDIKFFRKFFDREKCKIESVPGGNKSLEKCVDTLVETHSLILGIRDADFLKLSNDDYIQKNIFLTDKHDIETTILSDEGVLNAFVSEFSDKPKNEHLDLRNNIIESIKMISYLKWLNSRENLKLIFSPGFDNLVCFTNLNIDFDSYLKRVLSKSQNAHIKDIDTIKRKIDELQALNPDMLQLTNGHDLAKTFANYFRSILKVKDFSNKNIESSLRMLFNLEQLKTTNLYIELKNWCDDNNTTIFVK